MRPLLYLGMLLLSAISIAGVHASDSLVEKSEHALFQADFQLAMQYIDAAIEQAKQAQANVQYYSLLNQKAHILTRSGSYDSAYTIHSRVLEYSINQGETALEYETRYYVGVLKVFISDFEAANELFLQVTDFFKIDESHHQYMVARSFTNLAFLAYQQGLVGLAKEFLSQSSIYYKQDPTALYASSNHILEGQIAMNEGSFMLALEKYEQALKIYEAHGRVLNLSGLYLNMASAYLEAGRALEAKRYLTRAQEAAEDKMLPYELMTVYEFLYQYYYDQKAYKLSVDYLVKRDNILDSLRSTEMLLKVATQENRSAQKMEQLQFSLLQEKLSAERKINKTQRISIFIAIVVSLYLLVFILVYRRLIRDKNRSESELIIKNNQLQEKTEQIAKAQSLLIQSEKMALLGRISAGIAHEINTPISAIKGNLELIQDLQQIELDKLNELDLAAISVEEVRSLIVLISEAIEQRHQVINIQEAANIRKTVSKYFASVEISDKETVIDLMSELSVTKELHRFEPIYGHSQNTHLLEFASQVVQRAHSTKTASVATAKALKILGSFKTYSFKRGWKDIASIDISASIDVMLDLYKNELRNVELSKQVEGDSTIEGIQDELDQVWTNLIANSIYAMSSQGKLNITVQGLSNAVSVTIEDTGGGIHFTGDEDIFEPFYTTKPEGEGSGLGLDICKQIVKKHFGSISWKNTDEGVIFTVVLPRSFDKSLVPND